MQRDDVEVAPGVQKFAQVAEWVARTAYDYQRAV